MCDDTQRSCVTGVTRTRPVQESWASKWHTFQSRKPGRVRNSTVLEAVGPPALLPSLTEVFVEIKKIMEEKFGSTLGP